MKSEKYLRERFSLCISVLRAAVDNPIDARIELAFENRKKKSIAVQPFSHMDNIIRIKCAYDLFFVSILFKREMDTAIWVEATTAEYSTCEIVGVKLKLKLN